MTLHFACTAKKKKKKTFLSTFVLFANKYLNILKSKYIYWRLKMKKSYDTEQKYLCLKQE